MKSAVLLTASLTLATLAVQADSADPYRPTGRLNVSQHMVRQGVQPLLDWEITYPLKVTEIVDIDPTDDSITL